MVRQQERVRRRNSNRGIGCTSGGVKELDLGWPDGCGIRVAVIRRVRAPSDIPFPSQLDGRRTHEIRVVVGWFFSDSPCSSTSGRHPCLVRFAAAGMRPWNGLGSWPPFLTILEFCGRCGCHDGTPFTRVNRKLDMISSNSTYLPTGLLLSHRPCLLLKKNVPEPCRQRPLLGQHLTCPVGQRRLQALLGHHNITYPCTHLPSRQGYMGRDFVSTLTIASENAHLSQTAAIRADVCLNPCRNRDGHRNSFSHQHVQLHEQFTNVQLICI